MKYIKDHENLSQKKVLLRLDLNVPLKNGVIADQTRIDKILPIINFLLGKNSRIIVVSHVGRPNGKKNSNLSMRPICEYLEKKINKKIKLVSDDIFRLEKEDLFKEKFDEIICLENIRFYEEEEKNDTSLAKQLASLADLFVNDAFSCSHRAHTSICKITEFLPSFAGLQLEAELSALKKVTSEIKKPITCIIGGSKISTKIGIIKNLIPKFNNIIIVGGMANNILNYKGNQIGKSVKEENCENIIKEIFGSYPKGWYTGRTSPNTRRLIIENTEVIYDSDSYSDDLPNWEKIGNKKHLIIPYTLDNNDMRFATSQGFNSGEQFFQYLKDSFDCLYKEGEHNPKMMSVGLHCRLIGRPGRMQSLIRFLDYVQNFDDVWICRRDEIADYWYKNYQ